MEPQAIQTTSKTPTVQWRELEILSALSAYKENLHFGNHDLVPWTLFHLAYTARQAKLANNFHELMVLDCVQGFQPLPHQVETARRILQKMRGRAILADEVGLGKTIEAGLVLREYLLRQMVHKALVLVPASLVLQWTRELNQKFNINCFAQRNEWSWSQHDIVVASLDTAKRHPHREIIMQQPWDMLIVDEAHKLKNSRTKNWQFVNQIPNKFMLLLTATPMQNNLRELHTLVTLLKPGYLGNPVAFGKEHLEAGRNPKDPELLRSQVAQVMIRNRRLDGGTSLPGRKVSSVSLTLNPEERQFYEAVQEFLRSEYQQRKAARASLLSLITLQREICSSPYAAMITLEKMKKRSKNPETQEAIGGLLTLGEKIRNYTKVDMVLNLLNDIPDKCVIFTEYRATQDFLLYRLRQQGISAVPFRGGFGRGKKDWMKDLFSNKVQVLVATESGGEGINLQFCHHMINFDLPWNPMRLEQRIGRIHRLGQEHEVRVLNFATENTIEAHIVNLLQEKIRMFELIIGDLNHVLGETPVGANFERKVLDWSMESHDEREFQERLDRYGEEVLEALKQNPNKELVT